MIRYNFLNEITVPQQKQPPEELFLKNKCPKSYKNCPLLNRLEVKKRLAKFLKWGHPALASLSWFTYSPPYLLRFQTLHRVHQGRFNGLKTNRQ
jgi:hypothetical protein